MTDSPQQLPLTFSSHHNQSLFSDHYLDEILRRSDNWRPAIPQAQVFLAWLRDLYAQEKEQLAHYNEDQLEDKWFKPIFAQLGYDHWEGQAVIPGWQGSIKKPDFFFFPDAAARHTVVTDADGRYNFNGVAAGTYGVTAVLPNGLTAQIGPAVVSNGRGAVVGIAAAPGSGFRVHLPVVVR